MSTTTRRTLLLTAPAIALAACTASREGEASPSTSQEETTTTPPTTPADDERVDEPMPAEADKDERKAASAAAEATMSVWVKGSTMSERKWRKKLNATLTTTGQHVAERTWGYRVPDTELKGKPQVIRANEDSAVFRVRTDKNTYEVTVVKSAGGDWLTSNLTTTEDS